jgi:hypothetical protein
LWTLADDEGRLRGHSRVLASLLYPFDDDAAGLIDSWISQLEDQACLSRYTHDGTTYIQIHNWLKHQKIDRPGKSKLPRFDAQSRALANPREPSRALDADLGSRIIGSRTKDLGSRIKDPVRRLPPPNGWLADFKARYPARAGDQNWRGAQRAGNARLAEGHTVEEIMAGADRYAAFSDATGKTGTEYVKQAATFLGPSKAFLEPWDIPQSKADRRLNGNLSAADEFLRRTEQPCSQPTENSLPKP